jgi:hypothetical protein
VRDGLTARGLRYVVGISPETVVFTQQPHWVRRPRPRQEPPSQLWWPTASTPRPVAVGELAGRLQREPVTWRVGSKGELSAPFAWVRVPPEPVWQLVENPTIPEGDSLVSDHDETRRSAAADRPLFLSDVERRVAGLRLLRNG